MRSAAALDTDIVRAIDAEVDRRRDELISTLMDLIRVRTDAPSGDGYVSILRHLLPLFEEVGFAAERRNLPQMLFEERVKRCHPDATGIRSNLLATMSLPGRASMLWYTHLDTMPPGPMAQWSFDPFQPRAPTGLSGAEARPTARRGRPRSSARFALSTTAGSAPRSTRSSRSRPTRSSVRIPGSCTWPIAAPSDDVVGSTAATEARRT